MSKKFRILFIHILLIIGLFLVFGGLSISHSSINIEQSSFIDENVESMNMDNIIKYEEQYEQYEPILQNENLINSYNLNEFSNETQNDLHSLVNNEKTIIQNEELYEGEFIVHFDNTSYIFEGEKDTSNSIMISLLGYILIIISAILFITMMKDEENKNEKSLLNNVEIAGEDSEWDYVIVEDEKNENKMS